MVFSLALGIFAMTTVSAADEAVISVDGVEKTWSEWVGEAEATDYYSGKTVRLLADVTLAANSTSIADFKGTFDGAGKSISGLTEPLFAKLTGAAVKDLTLNGSIVYIGNQCGALTCQTISTVTLENVVNNCDILFTQTGGNASAAGLVGFSNAKLIATDCVNNGDVAAANTERVAVDVGGIVGYVKGTGCELIATRCVNTGKLTASVGNDTGNANTGILGGIAAWITGPASFTKCLNTGDIENISPVAHGGAKLGGIAGVIGATSATFTFESCVNTGNIKAAYEVGGIIGEIQSQHLNMSDCYNYGTLTSGGYSTTGVHSMSGGMVAYQRAGGSTLVGCANFGEINATLNTAAAANVYAGGLIGWIAADADLRACSSSGTVTSGNFSGGMVGLMNQADGSLSISDSFVDGTVSLLQNAIAGAKAGALIGQITAGEVLLENTKHLDSVNAVSYNGTVTDAEASYAVAQKADWRADQPINFEGIQYTLPVGGKFNVRLVASLPSIDYQNAGFVVLRVADGRLGRANVEIKTVYGSLTGFDESGVETVYQAADFGAEHLAALTVNGMPASGNVTLIVRPYATTLEGDVVYGEGYTVAFANGAYVS